MFEQLGVNLYLIAAVIVIGVFVPLVAGFVLDGLVAIIRGRGLKPVAVAISMTAAVAAIGFSIWKWNVEQGVGVPALDNFAESLRSTIRMLWQFSVPLSVLAFVARMISGFGKDR